MGDGGTRSENAHFGDDPLDSNSTKPLKGEIPDLRSVDEWLPRSLGDRDSVDLHWNPGDPAEIKKAPPGELFLNADDLYKADGRGFISEFRHSFMYSLVQSPLEGAAQTFDHTLGLGLQTDLHGSVKDSLVKAPVEAELWTSQWHGQAFGSTVAVIPWFLALRGGMRYGAGMTSMTKGMVVSSEAAAANTALWSPVGRKLMLEGGIVGAAYAGLLKPISEIEGDYWSAKGKHMAVDFLTFGTLTGGTLWLSPRLNPVGLNYAERFPNSSYLIRKGTNMVSGGLSGAPASVVYTASHGAFIDRSHLSSPTEYGKNLYTFGVLGFGLGAFHPAPVRPRPMVAERVAESGTKAVEPLGKEPEAVAKVVEPLAKEPETVAKAVEPLAKEPEGHRAEAPEHRRIPIESIEKLSYADWLARNKDHSEMASVTRYGDEFYIQKVWDQLESKFRALSPRQLVDLGMSWELMKPEQWATLSPDVAVKYAQLMQKFQPLQLNIELLFRFPDFVEWAHTMGGKGESSQVLTRILNIWDKLPEKLKEGNSDQLSMIASAWSRLSPEQWASLSLADAANVSKSVYVFDLRGKEASLIASTPDLAKYLSSNAIDYALAIKIIANWPHLTEAQKQIGPRELAKEIKRIQFVVQLESVFPRESPVFEYLKKLQELYPQVHEDLVRIIENAQLFPQERYSVQEVRSLVEKLAQENASFTDMQFYSLHSRLIVAKSFAEGSPTFEKLRDYAKGDWRALSSVVEFIVKAPDTNRQLVDLIVQEGVLHKFGKRSDFIVLGDLQAKLNLTGADTKFVLSLQKQGLNLRELLGYVVESEVNLGRVKDLIEKRAEKPSLSMRRLRDKDVLERLVQFSSAQKAQLEVMIESGLSMVRVENFLADSPQRFQHFCKLLAEGADHVQLNNFMSLSLFPPEVAVSISQSVKRGDVRMEDVLGHLMNWQGGRNLRDLMLVHVESGRPLSKAVLDNLLARARAAGEIERKHQDLQLQRTQATLSPSEQSIASAAATFEASAKAILSTVPKDKTIVILGRDAWPLVPILRAQGRDVQYYLFSRLQLGDDGTFKQWLREVPPDSVVIDTGYNGSIINRIKQFDPGVTGYLMSSDTANYKTLLTISDHRGRVSDLENYPKPIWRTHRVAPNGNAISRRKEGHSDQDTNQSFEKGNRWYVERQARELLGATGLLEWDRWRYSKFTGLSPGERLGLDSKAEVEAHYQRIIGMRKAAGKPIPEDNK